jgi:hypothetical protein
MVCQSTPTNALSVEEERLGRAGPKAYPEVMIFLSSASKLSVLQAAT